MTSMKFYYLWSNLKQFIQVYILRKNIARQPYHIMDLKEEDQSPFELFIKLIGIDFQPNYFSYHDKGELYNVRRLILVPIAWEPSFEEASGLQLQEWAETGTYHQIWQEHVRIFSDEIKAHLEVSYEEDEKKHVSGETVKELSDASKEDIMQLLGHQM